MASPEFMNSGWEELHWPMPVTVDGEGPAFPEETDHEICFKCIQLWPCESANGE